MKVNVDIWNEIDKNKKLSSLKKLKQQLKTKMREWTATKKSGMKYQNYGTNNNL